MPRFFSLTALLLAALISLPSVAFAAPKNGDSGLMLPDASSLDSAGTDSAPAQAADPSSTPSRGGSGGPGVGGEGALGIIAVANDHIITSTDLEQRMRLALTFSGLSNTPEVRKRLAPQLLQRLIEEILQKEELGRQRILVSEAEISNAQDRMRQQFQLSEADLAKLLKARGIRPETLRTQLEAEVGWSKFLFQRLRPKIIITEQEIDEAIEAISGGNGVREYLISDILLPVDNPDSEENAKNLADNLVKEINSGKSFENLATQFPAVRQEGDSGKPRWVTPDDLDPSMGQALRNMKEGQLSAPIRTPAGYQIMKLQSTRNLMGTDPDQSEVLLKQIVLPLPEKADKASIDARFSEAERLAHSISGCSDFRRKSASIEDAKYQDLGRLQLNQLHEEVRKLVRDMPADKITAPFRTPLGVHLIAVCERIDAQSTIVDRTRVRTKLLEKKLMLEALRNLRNLRREAYVDVRVGRG